MYSLFIIAIIISGVFSEPETVRDNFDYFNYGSNEDVMKNLDLHLVSG